MWPVPVYVVHHHFVLSLYSTESQFSSCWFLLLNLVNILSLSSVLKMHFLKVKVTFVIPIIESFVQNLHGSLEYYFSLKIFIAKLVEIDDTVLTIPLNWFKLELPRRPNNTLYRLIHHYPHVSSQTKLRYCCFLFRGCTLHFTTCSQTQRRWLWSESLASLLVSDWGAGPQVTPGHRGTQPAQPRPRALSRHQERCLN